MAVRVESHPCPCEEAGPSLAVSPPGRAPGSAAGDAIGRDRGPDFDGVAGRRSTSTPAGSPSGECSPTTATLTALRHGSRHSARTSCTSGPGPTGPRPTARSKGTDPSRRVGHARPYRSEAASRTTPSSYIPTIITAATPHSAAPHPPTASPTWRDSTPRSRQPGGPRRASDKPLGSCLGSLLGIRPAPPCICVNGRGAACDHDSPPTPSAACQCTTTEACSGRSRSDVPT